MIKILKPFQYDDEIIIKCGVYNYIECGVNYYPMIQYNNTWYDIVDIDDLFDNGYVIIINV